MSAADHLREAIDFGCTRDDHDHVGSHRAEVLEEVAVWLGKKAREYRSTNSRETQAEVLERMADKIRRGAVRPAVRESDPARHVARRMLGRSNGWDQPTEGELAEQRHLVDPLDHALEALAPHTEGA